MTFNKPVKSVVLAAGQGKRIRTEGVDLPKVMRQASGLPLLHYVLSSLDFLPADDIIIVVGYMREQVIDAFPDYAYAVQEEQKGTGHAVASAKALFQDFHGDILVCYGDMPLLRRETYIDLLKYHGDSGNKCTILSGSTDHALPYGRIVRDDRGQFQAIVEDRDCTEEQKKITELNSGVYVFDSAALLNALSLLDNKNSQKEYYLTDAPAIILSDKQPVGVFQRDLGPEILGVNTVQQLEEVEEIINARINQI
jgi:UDP-N-acetylglucosamine diphosphorylase/glucosamine-1-phosphate N-acetyltransferase